MTQWLLSMFPDIQRILHQSRLAVGGPGRWHRRQAPEPALQLSPGAAPGKRAAQARGRCRRCACLAQAPVGHGLLCSGSAWRAVPPTLPVSPCLC